MLRSRWLTPLFTAFMASACAGATPPGTPSQRDPTPRVPETEISTTAEYDLIIENGRIVDGTGSAWFYGDIAVKNGRIARIVPKGVLRGTSASQRIDAYDHVVSPGFIDIQSQSRYALLDGDSKVISKVTQGITTEIMGEGTSSAPINPAYLARAGADDSRIERRRRSFAGPHGFDAWLRAMEARGTSVNQGSFLGAGTIRSYASGSRMGDATAVELDTMKMVVRRAMEDGAFGIASALIYPPGNFASTTELSEISAAMAPYGGVYITHMRSEANQILEAIDEAIEIGSRAGVAVEIYHLKAGGRENWPKAAQAIAKIDSARAAGVDIQANMYPYEAASTGLTACFPPWASANGRLYSNLADDDMRNRIRADIENETGDWENLCSLATPSGVLILGLGKAENRKYVGRYLDDIAKEHGKDWIDTAMDLVLEERQRVGSVYFLMSEENVRLQLRQPWMKFGTDAGGVNPVTTVALVHPRSYGTFPRILGRYVREQGVLPLEDAIRKMSSAVATRLSIADRGVLKEGLYADIVIFDPETIIDRATFEEPHRVSEGVRDVFVNGVAVVRNGRHTGAKPGMIVRGPGYRPAASPPISDRPH
jgi:dihydroorotase/N-acyl-D-amino-acid deacylase